MRYQHKKNTSKRNSTLSLFDILKKHGDYIDTLQIASALKTYK